MAYYCGECAIWAGSGDVDRYNRHWCPVSRRFEEANQNIYGCRGFVYNGRSIVTRVCEILDIPPAEWFDAFDAVKDAYVVPFHTEWLTSYCVHGPAIASAISRDPKHKSVAMKLLNDYMIPARDLYQQGQMEAAAHLFRYMVAYLIKKYSCSCS